MANIIIFHSALGYEERYSGFQWKLMEKWHQVFVVDLYNGKSFDDIKKPSIIF